jgi:hypothetical protein
VTLLPRAEVRARQLLLVTGPDRSIYCNDGECSCEAGTVVADGSEITPDELLAAARAHVEQFPPAADGA